MKESKILITGMIINFIIACLKVVSGIIFNLSSLLGDGMHTFSDFITDIVIIISTKLSLKKPTKHHPFGFGRLEYLSNILVGFILFLLAIFILIHGLNSSYHIPSLSVLYVLVISLILKSISIYKMYKYGKILHSNVLLNSYMESTGDLYSTICVIIVTVLLQFSTDIEILKYSDKIGSIIISLYVFKTSIHTLITNCLACLGEVEENKEDILKIENFLKTNEHLKNFEISLIKYGVYYKMTLIIKLKQNLTLNKISKIVKKLEKDIIRHRSLKVKYVSIYIEKSE